MNNPLQRETGYFSFTLLFVFFSIFFNGCQSESEDITPPSADKVILPNSGIANFIQRMALRDGSPDNILDNSSCTSLLLPVTVVVNGLEIIIASEDEYDLVERILDEANNDIDNVALRFPVTIVLADYTKQIVNNKDELEDVIEKCIENGNDDDIECIDFKYPLSFTFYDSDNQVSGAITINDDKGLLEFFNGRAKGKLVGFKFPISVLLSSGEEIIINDNKKLEDTIENVSKNCDEDDDNDHNDDDADDTALIATLTNGEWKVSYFFDKKDETLAFENSVFSFIPDGTVLVTTKTSLLVMGKWKSFGDAGFLELELDFGNEPLFDDISEDWDLIESTNLKIKLNRVDKRDGSVSTLIFEKK